MLTVKIKNLRLRTYIGFNTEEREKRQDIVINIKFDYEAQKAADTDDVEYAVNYKVITKEVIAFVEGRQFLLLEKLASDILDLVMKNKLVQFAEIQVDKPHALRFADSVSATVSASHNLE